MTTYDLKHEGEAVDAAVSAVESGSVVTDNTVSSIALGEAKPASADAIAKELQKKVDKVEGKGLSTNDYDNEDKSQVERVRTGSVVVENTLSALDDTSDKPVSGKAVGAYKSNSLQDELYRPVALPVTGEAVLDEINNCARIVRREMPAYKQCTDIAIPANSYVINRGVTIAVADNRALDNRIDIAQGEIVHITTNKAYVSILAQGGVLDLSILPDSIAEIPNAYVSKGFVIDSINQIIGIGGNLVDAEKVVEGYYVRYATGELTASAGWCATDFIRVKPNATYSSTELRDYAFYDVNKKYISGVTGYFKTLTIPDNEDIYYIRFSTAGGKKPTDIVLCEGEIAVQDAFHYLSPRLVTNTSKVNAFRVSNSSLSKNSTLNTPQVYICKDFLLSAKISSPFVSIQVGQGKAGYYGKNFLINQSQVQLRGGSDDAVIAEYAHGLTLGDNTTITISKGHDMNATLRIVNDFGEAFEKDVAWGTAVGGPFLTNYSESAIDAELRFFPRALSKEIWMFGDSYFGMYDPSRWLYYMLEQGYTDYLVNAMGGESATSALTDLMNLLSLGHIPTHIVWCHGMNGGRDTSDAPNSNWLEAMNKFLLLCKSYNITPILATIPSVPTEIHTLLNEWVRTSGHRYIDFATAVEAGTGYYWKGWGTDKALLSADEVHPSAFGAKALAAQVLIDFPEITVKD